MFWTKTFIPTLRDDPADAELVSHKLLTRGGYIRKLTSGVYNYLPLMQKTIHKVSQIVREELNRAGLATLLFDLLTPEEAADRRNVFDIELLAGRLVRAATWLPGALDAALPLGLFGASTGQGPRLGAA